MAKGVSRALLAATLMATLPGAALAQEEPTTPEGTTWHLTAYAADEVAEIVPWVVDATLLLEGGTASGSGGCDSFSGSYTIDGEALTFGEAFSVTRKACPHPRMSVEDAYLPLLPETASWAIEDDVLVLSDALGEPLLEYEQAVAALTPSDLAAIAAQFDAQQAQIDRAGERIDSIRIGALRDRITELETTVARLRTQVANQSSASSSNSSPGSGSASAFNAREKVLLKAILGKVEKTCRPIRSGLPSGTVAAVACDGVRKAVAEMAYHLMEWGDAEATLRSVANANGVPNRNPNCSRQREGWISQGTQIGAEACFIDSDGKGNFRLITRASGCHQLNLAGTQMKEPAIYLAIEGVNRKLEPLRAAGLAYTDASYYLQNFEVGEYIPWGNQPRTPACRNITDQPF